MTHLFNFQKGNFKSLKGFSAYYRGIIPTLLFQPTYPMIFYRKLYKVENYSITNLICILHRRACIG